MYIHLHIWLHCTSNQIIFKPTSAQTCFIFSQIYSFHLTMVSFGDLVGRGTIRHLRGRWIGDSHPKELNPCIANPNQRRLRNCIFRTPNMHLDLAPFPSFSSFSKAWFITEIDNLKVFKTKSFQLISTCTQFPSIYFFWIAIQSDPFHFFFSSGLILPLHQNANASSLKASTPGVLRRILGNDTLGESRSSWEQNSSQKRPPNLKVKSVNPASIEIYDILNMDNMDIEYENSSVPTSRKHIMAKTKHFFEWTQVKL